jgi:hypothetical protein
VKQGGLPFSQDLGPPIEKPRPVAIATRTGLPTYHSFYPLNKNPTGQDLRFPAYYIGENCPLTQLVGEGGVVLAPRLESARICESSEVMQNSRTPVLL